ncbi:hypothetical protein [Paraburkholderia hayleyella]|uniref:hypothetical protein n=1 Tax=Paraburkholderia hayleyella TaxID=2152889 RepID=UPI001580DDA8|nr:hypothetical protein [Paraburkholderia hayleyella]
MKTVQTPPTASRAPSPHDEEHRSHDSLAPGTGTPGLNAPKGVGDDERERFRRALQTDVPAAGADQVLTHLDVSARLARRGDGDDSGKPREAADESGSDGQHDGNRHSVTAASPGTPQPQGMGDLLRLMRRGASAQSSSDTQHRYSATRQALDLELVISAVERLWTDADGGRHGTLSAELNQATLPGVTLSLSDDGTTLWVAFQCHLKAPYERLGSNRYVLAEKLAVRLERDVMVQVSHGREPTLEARGLYQSDDE